MEKTVNYTHKKKTYFATCIRWNDDNTDEVIQLIESAGASVTYLNGHLMIRWNDPRSYKYSICTIEPGDWVRKGENGVMKLMKDHEFKLKYETV